MSNLALFPAQEWLVQTNPVFNVTTLNANTNDFGIVFQMPEAATITTIGWRQGTQTGTPGTLRVGLQGVSATTGRNDGTYLGGASNFVDYTGWSTANNNTFITHTLPTSVSLTRGQLVCLYLDPQAVGTWNASNNVTVTNSIADVRRGVLRPYYFANAAIVSEFNPKVFLLRSSTKTYGNPAQAYSNVNITTSTNPDEIGFAFTIGSSNFSTYQIGGVRFVNNVGASTSSFDLVLYDNTTALQTVTFDTDQTYRFANNTFEIYFTDTTLATLNTGTEYILAQKAKTAVTSTCQPAYITCPTNGDITAYSSETMRYCQRQLSGAWSFTNDTRLPLVNLLIKSTAFTGGSGGLLVHPGTAGGMRG